MQLLNLKIEPETSYSPKHRLHSESFVDRLSNRHRVPNRDSREVLSPVLRPPFRLFIHSPWPLTVFTWVYKHYGNIRGRQGTTEGASYCCGRPYEYTHRTYVSQLESNRRVQCEYERHPRQSESSSAQSWWKVIQNLSQIQSVVQHVSEGRPPAKRFIRIIGTRVVHGNDCTICSNQHIRGIKAK